VPTHRQPATEGSRAEGKSPEAGVFHTGEITSNI